MKLSERIYLIPKSSVSNSYLFVSGDSGLVLIDTGLRGGSKRVAEYAESIGLDQKKISFIVLTHPDIDHAGSVLDIKKKVAQSAIVAIGEADAPVLAGEKPQRKFKGMTRLLTGLMMTFAGPKPIKPDLLLKDGERVGSDLLMLSTPGHTEGSICLLSEKDRTLFSGDTLITNGTGNPTLPSSAVNYDQTKLKESVKKIAKLDFDLLLPGHGRPITSKASDKVKEFAEKLV